MIVGESQEGCALCSSRGPGNEGQVLYPRASSKMLEVFHMSHGQNSFMYHLVALNKDPI